MTHVVEDIIQPIVEKNTSICNDCINISGGCCTEVNFTISSKEIAPFVEAEKNGFPDGHTLTLNHDGEDIQTYDYDSGDDRCVFLGMDNRCMIYERRPIICQTYPINWRIKRKKITFHLDFVCVLSHSEPIKKFYQQTTDPKIVDQCIELGDMDFNAKESRYINLSKLSQEADPMILIKE
ncbi:MAG: YkgJ family cysteine cluster protein [Candidatus Heimdallarchaeota archaeon]|nr:YkgJ family cysteine cluster protein [Candidatus Heimdallarchaeota archaeon]